MPAVGDNKSPYIDELSPSAVAGAGRFRKATIDPRIEGIQENKQASIAEESEQFIDPSEMPEEFDADRDVEKENVDEFSKFNPERDREKGKNKQRRKRRIGKIKRANALEDEDFSEEDVFGFLGFLDQLWIKLTEIIESVGEEFENWNNWFKKEKKKPPAPDSSKVVYVREEFNAKRSPHLWKSDPNRNWILTFGNNKINNIVASILYKYQNETISKDA